MDRCTANLAGHRPVFVAIECKAAVISTYVAVVGCTLCVKPDGKLLAFSDIGYKASVAVKSVVSPIISIAPCIIPCSVCTDKELIVSFLCYLCFIDAVSVLVSKCKIVAPGIEVSDHTNCSEGDELLSDAEIKLLDLDCALAVLDLDLELVVTDYRRLECAEIILTVALDDAVFTVRSLSNISILIGGCAACRLALTWIVYFPAELGVK